MNRWQYKMNIYACMALLTLSGQVSLAEEKEWGFALGAGVGVSNSLYEKNKTEVGFLPIAVINWNNVSLSADGLEYAFFDNDALSLAASLNYRGKPDFPNKPKFAGLKRKGSVEGGLSGSYDFGYFDVEASFTHDISSHHKGYAAEIGIGKSFTMGDTIWHAGLGAEYQDKKLSQHLYGVSSAEANSLRAAYTTKGSWSPFVELSVMMPIDKHSQIFGFAEYKHLSDEIKDSPLVEAKHEAGIGIGYVYSF